MKIKISIIIPIFNAVQYIDNCLTTLLAQGNKQLEIICVDDGSTDGSAELIRSFGKRDRRVKYLYQRNEGAGSARNLGMQVATGEYLLFLDVDDIFEKNMLSLLVENINDQDIIVFDADQFDATSNKVNGNWSAIHFLPENKDLFSAEEVRNSIFNFTIPAAWNKLFKRSFIESENIYFQNIRSSNDLFFTYASLCKGKKITVINKKLVHYRYNNEFSIQGNSNKNIYDAFDALMKLDKYLKTNSLYKPYEKSYIKMACDIVVYTLSRAKNTQLVELRNDPIIKCYIENLIKNSDFIHRHILEDQIIIYGAGVVAQVFVRYITEVMKISKTKISVLISNEPNDGEMVCNIKIQSIRSFDPFQIGTIYICATSEKSKIEMIKNAKKYQIERIECISDVELLSMMFKA